MYKTFASAEFKKGPQQPSYEDQFRDILAIFKIRERERRERERRDILDIFKIQERERRERERRDILDEYFTWIPADLLTWTTDTRIWNYLWTNRFEKQFASEEDFLAVYEWLYPELSEIQNLKFKDKLEEFKDTLEERRNERKLKQATKLKAAITKAKHARLIKEWKDAGLIKQWEEDAAKLAEIKERELEKKTRDNEREKAIKNDTFETYKFTESLYVRDIVKVSGYVGRLLSITEDTMYEVTTFHDNNTFLCGREELFRPIPESDDIAYRDDNGDCTYDSSGYLHGYYDEDRDGWYEHGEFTRY